MMRPRRFVRWFSAALFAALLVTAATAPASAQNLQSGDIIVPGANGGNGCFYRIRGGVVTRLFETNAFTTPRDMMVDSQGRLVFFASPLSRNSDDTALFRIDPATGVLERLFYFPYVVASGDTLPQGAPNAVGFYGVVQALHLEQRMEIIIEDDVNGGWPQIQTGRYYGFAMQTTVSTGAAPTNYRYRPDSGVCEVGISTAPLPWPTAPYMASEDSRIYYGLNGMIGRTGLDARVELHLDGNWGHFDFNASLSPKNELIITGHVFDNTRDPNGYVNCGSAIDSDVPFAADGASFSALSMTGLGVVGGGLYITSNSGATGVPYVFNIAPRAPYLNPYVCIWDTATEGTGLLGFNLPDGTPTTCPYTSPDGDAVLGMGDGTIKRVDMAGHCELIDASVTYTGRPWRWHGASSAPLRAAASTAQADSGTQVLVVRVDALAYVMLTDSQGRRIGYDAAGSPVNDFGQAGALLAPGGGGWPRLIVLRDPPSETLAAQIAATGAGAWSVSAYLMHEAGGNLLATTSGNAIGAGSAFRGLYVGQPALLTWFADPVVGVEPSSAPDRTGFVSLGPIPARSEVRFAYRVPQSGARVRLDIFDIAGRLVTTLVNGPVEGGVHNLSWDGRDVAGARLANGVYLAGLDLNGRRETRRIVLAH